MRRGADGATSTDMAVIAQRRAVEYERSIDNQDAAEVAVPDESEE
tara:strand:- start:267 stop:401 length:135 start_codon:yes stop_codon:yes gene_type:complete